MNLAVHDKQVSRCGNGIVSDAAWSLVGEVVDAKTFLAGRGSVPLERRQSHRYRGWNLAWFRANKPAGQSVLESFDPETFRFTVTQPREIKVGDRFEVFPASANWKLHDNTIAGCLHPVVFSSHGSETSLFQGNLVTRDDATGVKEPLEVHGVFQLIGNHLHGFEAEDASVKKPEAKAPAK